MKRSRRLALVFGGLIVGMACFAACGFPDVEFASDDGRETGAADVSPSSDVTSADGRTDAGPVDASNADVILDADPDVAVVEDAGGKVDASGCAACDCDKDGFSRNLPDCGAGTFDCDDNDTRSHPGQLYLEEGAEPPMNGNWNCDDELEKGYQENIHCEGLLLGLGCTSVVGFTGTVACGHKGKFVRCKQVPVLGLPLACGVDPDSLDNDKIQVCK